MNLKIFILSFLFPFLSHAKELKISDVSWLTQLAEKSVREFHVCGNSKIQPSKKSLAKHFILGSKQTGFLFSDMVSKQKYFSIISENNLNKAKSALQTEFNKAHLWKYTKEKGFEDLGTPSKIDIRITATIKDCMEGARTTLGNDCTDYQGDRRRSCCTEKFVGPNLFWGNNDEFQLMYSPDPSVRLKVSHEKNHRYCNVQESITLR